VPAADIACVPSIGIARRDMLPMVKDPVSIEWMRALKTTLDPNGILNPWKMF
jgi:FAD/FMN-containing dehydrogenase